MAESIIAERYRTRFPPKEHQEAVRMLLEGVEKQQIEEKVNQSGRKTAPMTAEGTRKITNYHLVKAHRAKQSDRNSLGDRKSLNSSSTATETNSSSGIVDYNDLQVESVPNGVAKMQSKSTSTSESISTTSASSERSVLLPGDVALVQPDDLIPSRTVAVQCDLKWSSVKARDTLFDTSMQASSVSSTKYGFYSYNYETLAKRHRMQRSTSYRDLDGVGVNDDQGRAGRFATEAPTSMSELSDSSTSDDENLSKSEDRKRRALYDRRKDSQLTTGVGMQQASRLPPRGNQMYGSVMDNSMSTARARINSLPRRPMTALSYVSTGKLKHLQKRSSDADTSDSSDDSDLRETRRGLSKSKKFSSVSHQNLVRPKTPLSSRNNNLASSSDAGSDVDADADHPGGLDRKHVGDDYDRVDGEENRRSEEVILKSSRVAGAAINPRPKLVEARHEEEVQDLNGVLEQFRRAESELRNNNQVYGEKYSTLRPSGAAERGKNRLVASTMSLPRRATGISQRLSDETKSEMRTRRQAPQVDSGNPYRYQDRMGAEDFSSSRKHETQRQSQVGRSTSMRQVSSKPSVLRRYERPQRQSSHCDDDDGDGDGERLRRPIASLLAHDGSQPVRPMNMARASRAVNEDDSDALGSKTWSNPAGSNVRAWNQMPSADEIVGDGGGNVSSARKKVASRSMSMRDVNETTKYGATRESSDYNPYKSNMSFTAKYNDEYSSSESSDMMANENVVRNLAARLKPLDYDSQQRLNESGLPEVNTNDSVPKAMSCLGPKNNHYNHGGSQDGLQLRYLSSGSSNRRGSGQIKGRAMSQQSLSRPTMPVSASGRRWQATGLNSASSDVGGSSMSLATRLHGRYESAHTRSPIVMYIPPASTSRANSLKGDDSLLGVGSSSRHQRSTLKRGSRSPRSRSRHGSQDRSLLVRRQRSISRNGSDSEGSSMLRSLAAVRGSRGAESAYSSKRIARMQNIPVNNMIDTDEEDLDGVGRLATEVDSYKFIRRYSVPKDAKINWFTRLRQRVASGNR